jgi:hypothetical protein
MTTDNFCFYLQNRLIQTSQTGGQWYSETSPISIPWFVPLKPSQQVKVWLVKVEFARVKLFLVFYSALLLSMNLDHRHHILIDG